MLSATKTKRLITKSITQASDAFLKKEGLNEQEKERRVNLLLRLCAATNFNVFRQKFTSQGELAAFRMFFNNPNKEIATSKNTKIPIKDSEIIYVARKHLFRQLISFVKDSPKLQGLLMDKTNEITNLLRDEYSQLPLTQRIIKTGSPQEGASFAMLTLFFGYATTDYVNIISTNENTNPAINIIATLGLLGATLFCLGRTYQHWPEIKKEPPRPAIATPLEEKEIPFAVITTAAGSTLAYKRT